MLDSLQLQLCDIQGRLFELSLLKEVGSESFITQYMKSKAAADYGLGYNRLQWAGEEYLLEEVLDECRGNLKNGEKFSKDEMFWIGYTYAYWHIFTGESSENILAQAPPKTMKRAYAGLHTVDMQLAIKDLKKSTKPASVFGFDRELKNNAVLNWWFDDRTYDINGKATDKTKAWDFINLGKAYLGNSLINITLIMDIGNKGDIADKMIFPIIFAYWHGIELLLKAGVFLTEMILKTGNSFPKRSHQNSQLLKVLVDRLKQLNFNGSEFKNLKALLDDFDAQAVKPDPTFMRYTVDDKEKDHFYVARKDDENICIKIKEFAHMMAASIDEIIPVIDFLAMPFFEDYDYLRTGGRMDKDAFLAYKKHIERIDNAFDFKEEPLVTEAELKGVAKMIDVVWEKLL